jgi:hypothetical protein
VLDIQMQVCLSCHEGKERECAIRIEVSPVVASQIIPAISGRGRGRIAHEEASLAPYLFTCPMKSGSTNCRAAPYCGRDQVRTLSFGWVSPYIQ